MILIFIFLFLIGILGFAFLYIKYNKKDFYESLFQEIKKDYYKKKGIKNPKTHEFKELIKCLWEDIDFNKTIKILFFIGLLVTPFFIFLNAVNDVSETNTFYSVTNSTFYVSEILKTYNIFFIIIPLLVIIVFFILTVASRDNGHM